jgi:glycosyltransferase involved in cell wall biosynthesis
VTDRPKTGFLAPVREWTLGSRGRARDRGLRGWARKVSRHLEGNRSVLALVTDAYGASGGIALCMRDLIAAVCAGPGIRRVLALPRRAPGPIESLPEGVSFETSAAGSKLRFGLAALRATAGRIDAVVCGHINLLPVAHLAARRARAPLVLVVHGIDAWKPTRSALANRIAASVDAAVAVSELTRRRFLSWSGLPPDRCTVLPNALHPGAFAPGPRPGFLAERHGIPAAAKVIMTLGRLASTERYKGVDEVLEAMPRLLRSEPRLMYVVGGEGDDRARLERKAAQLGVARQVVFTGFIAENEKPEHYRLADAYVMPSRGEGFGFVFLEAMASGLPVVGSKIDGGREALLEGRLGRLVDPDDAADLDRAILEALASPKQVPPGLEHFDFDRFARRWHRLLDRVCLAH